MRTVSIIINAAIFGVTAILVALDFRRDGEWRLENGRKAFRFFTVLSNALCGVAALAMAVAQLRGGVPRGVMLFKYLGTASVTVTLMTVLLFLGPSQGGYAPLFAGNGLYLHLIGPLLAIASFCFLEKDGLTLPEALLGLVPVALYGVLYCYKAVFAPEKSRWEDFYGFNRGGRWPVAFAGMMIGTLAVCVALWLL